MPRPALHPALITLTTIVLLLAAVVALFAHQDPRSYSTPTSSGSASDVVTYGESLVGLLIAGATTAFAWWASVPFRGIGGDAARL